MAGVHSFFVDSVLEETFAGYVCFCYLNNVCVERRPFRDQADAEEYGLAWASEKAEEYAYD